MKYKIRYSPKALTDLDEIWDYIFVELENPTAAEHVTTSMINTIDTLEAFPERGAPLSSISEVESHYRFLLSGNYMIFYRIEHESISVDRILYQGRNYIKILFNDSPTRE